MSKFYAAIANGDMGLCLSGWYGNEEDAVAEAVRRAEYQGLTDWCFMLTFEGEIPPKLGCYFPQEESIELAFGWEGDNG